MNAPAFHTPDPEAMRLDAYLDEWAEYHRAPSGRLGYLDHAVGLVGGGASQDFDAMFEKEVTLPRIKAIDTIVNEDMRDSCRAAIQHRYRFAVFRFPRGNYPQLLEEARAHVVRGLRIRHLWIT